MARTKGDMAIIVYALSFLSCVFVVHITRTTYVNKISGGGKDTFICNYEPLCDKAVVFGYLSSAFWVVTMAAGYLSQVYPYGGRHIPHDVLFRSPGVWVCFNLATFTAVSDAPMLFLPTIARQLHLSGHVRRYPYSFMINSLGDGVLYCIISTILWLVTLVFTNKVREQYFDRVDKDAKPE